MAPSNIFEQVILACVSIGAVMLVNVDKNPRRTFFGFEILSEE